MKSSGIKKFMLYSLACMVLILKTNTLPGKERTINIPFVDRSPVMSLQTNYEKFSKDRLKHKDMLLKNIYDIESFNILEQYVLQTELGKTLKKLEVENVSELKKKVIKNNLEAIFTEYYADTTSKHSRAVISFMRENNINTEAAFKFLKNNKTGIILPKADFEARKKTVLEAKKSGISLDRYLLSKVEKVIGDSIFYNSNEYSKFSEKNFEKVQKYDKKINITQTANKMGIDPLLIKSMIMKESAGNPYAVSFADAKGLLQLMDDTSELMGVKDPFNPRQNVNGGTKYFKMLYDTYEGYPEPVRLIFTFSAWNAGPGNTYKILSHNKLPRESKYFIKDVFNNYNVLKSRKKS